MLAKINKKIFLFIIVFSFLLIPSPYKPALSSEKTCAWRVEVVNSLVSPATFTGGCHSYEKQSPHKECEELKKPEKGTGDRLWCCCDDGAPLIKKTPDLNPLGNLQVKIPGLDKIISENPISCDEGSDTKACGTPWLAIYIKAIYNYMIGIGAILAAIALMIAGVIWLVSAGNTSRVSQAKNLIMGSITGIILLLTSYVLLYQVNPDLVSLQYIKTIKIEPEDIDTSVDESSENPYIDACLAAKNGNLDPCQNLGTTKPNNLEYLSEYQKYFHPNITDKFKNAMKCVEDKNYGKKIFSVSESWRSPAEQIRMKENWTSKGKPGNAATPCCSNHGSGVAVDLYRLDGQKMTWNHNETTKLKECMNAQGLYANISSEPWHWSPSGK